MWHVRSRITAVFGSDRCLRLAVLGLLVWCTSCVDDTKLASRCGSDADCPPGLVCRDGFCGCDSDADCGPDEFCNQVGSCQIRVGCDSTLDCPAGSFCDRTTGQCLDEVRCTDDVQCPLGEVCDTVSFTCEPGCRQVGDCPLGDICRCPGGGETCAGEALGACITGPCTDDSYCRYGERCVVETEGQPGRCQRDTRGPFCDPCTIAAAQSLCPGEEANFCLVDSTKGYGSFFCGVECQDDAQCPWGFGCSDVLILTESTCGTGTNQCPLRPSPSCQTDADCMGRGTCDTGTGSCRCDVDADCPGGVCDPESHQCRGRCVGGENDVQGFCTCLQDSDCPADTCNSQDFRCTISRKPCDPEQPDSCGQIYCKQVRETGSAGSIGYCFIGRNCAPAEGISCDQVRAQRR